MALAVAGLSGCSNEPAELSETTAQQKVYAAEDDAVRARFEDGLRLGGREVPVTRGAAPGYVPDVTCRRCHPEIADSYDAVGMSHAFWKAGPDALIEDFSDAHHYHEASDRHYEMTYSEGTYEIERYQIDDDGMRYNELSRPIDSIIGSGHKGRTYLYRTPTDELYQVPLAWYVEQGKWMMSPGYERARHSGFLRQMTRDCMFCHNGYPEVAVGSDRVGQLQRFPKELPQGLGCQRCHGPGAEHVAVANDPQSTLAEISAAIFNSGRLEQGHRTDVCMQCHLQPDSSVMSIVRRLGRADYSYRPDQPLNDYLVHVDHDGTDDLFQINHHPYRLFQSRCHLESNGRLTCLTCHDPHVKPASGDRVAHYRAACLSCHELDQCDSAHMQSTAASIDAVNCVGCHMPKRRTHDVIEIVMTDHLIRRTPPTEDLTAWQPRRPAATHGAYSVFQGVELRGVDADILSAISGVRDGDPAAIEQLRKAIESGDADDVDALLRLASGQWNSGAFAEAARTCQRVTETHPDLAFAQRMLGRALLKIGRPGQALSALERARELDANDPETFFGIGLAYTRLGQPAAALEGFQAAVRLRPLHADAHLNIGHLLANQRQHTAAAKSYRWVHRIDPTRADGYYFRGVMLFMDNQLDEAIVSWRRGRRAAPDDPPLAAAQALGLFDKGDHDKAIAAAAAASDLGADPAICLLVQALAEHELGRQTEAAATHARAQAQPRRPGIETTLRAVLEWRAGRRLGK